MQLAETYIRLASQAQSTLDASNQLSLDNLYKHFDIELNSYVRTTNAVNQHLIEQMESALVTTGQSNELTRSELRKLLEHLALEYFSGDLPSKDIMGPLELLNWVGVIKDKVPSFEAEDAWLRVISLAKDYAIVSPSLVQDERSMRRGYCRKYAISQAVKHFRRQGYEVRIEDAKPVVQEVNLREIAESIEGDIKALGGAWFVGYIFEVNKPSYDASMQRIHFVRRYESVPTASGCVPGVPYGYLLNLAMKHSQPPPALLKAEEGDIVLKRVLETSRYFAALYDVQNYYQLNIALQSANSIVDFVQETALYDSFFVPVQARPSDVPTLLKGLFSWVDQREMREKLGFDLEDYISVTRQILALPRQRMKPTHFHRTNIKLVGGRKAQRDAVLGTISHKPKIINDKYLLPDDYEAETFSKRPLVELQDNWFGLASTSWCGIAFYEALFLLIIKKFGQSASDKVGDATEKILRALLRSKGVSYGTGKYNVGKSTYECDAVVETPNFIYFIEVKKKPLTRKARSGGKADLFIDIFESMYDSQFQALRHRFHLTKAGALVLSNGSEQHTINHNGRRIVSLSLTTSEFGGFQDRLVTQQFLKLVYSLHFSTDSGFTPYEGKFAKINEKVIEFRRVYEDLIALDLDEKQAVQNGAAFFYSLFLSLPQCLVTLDEVHDNSSFENAFRHTLHLTTASQDYYFELAQARSTEN